MKKYLKLMRVHHYIKNGLIFAALACSGQLFDSQKFLACMAGFVSFCMVSSAVYIINDIKDAEKDRNHPTKCKRPIANGSISPKKAKFIVLLLLAIAVFCNYFIFDYLSASLLSLYFILNLLYSLGLKNIPILDIMILVSGFFIRVLYGALITDVTISNWLYLTVFAVSFYFALGKRRNELKQHGENNTRIVLKHYPLPFLDKSMGMCLTLANAFYALWTMDEKTVSLYDSSYLIFSVPIVLLITMKYSLDIEGDMDGDPVEVLLHDKILILFCILYLIFMFAILYL